MNAHDLIEAGDTVSIGRGRQWLAMEALGEARGLCDLLRLATKNGSTEEAQIVRGLSIRMGELLDAVGSAISDPHDDLGDIAERVGIVLDGLQEADA